QLTQGSLLRAKRLMDSHPEVAFTYGPAIKTDDPTRAPCIGPSDYAEQVLPGAEFFHTTCTTGENVVDAPAALVRTTFQKRVGGYKEALPHACDMEMWLRLALHGAVGFIGAYQAFYRLHDKNMFLGYRGLEDLRQRKAVFDCLFDENPDLVRPW